MRFTCPSKGKFTRTSQEIYLKTFNNTWDQYKEPKERRGNESREETSHKVAWSAVKHTYKKSSSGKWEKNSLILHILKTYLITAPKPSSKLSTSKRASEFITSYSMVILTFPDGI